jgi:glycosyltransferase involved in cell wall biosynthesis
MYRAYPEWDPPPGKELPWSLMRILDEDDGDTGFGAVRSPVDREDREFFEGFAQERRLIGVSAYGTFPRIHVVFDGKRLATKEVDGRERPEVARCVAWAHCFRNPGRYLPAGRPRILMSISDFTDPEWVSPSGLDTPTKKRWDLIYLCCANHFNEMTKNWALAKRCLSRLARDLGITVLLVGRDQAPDVPDVPGIETRAEMPWDELMSCVAQARVAFFPNVLDASPVFLTEALCLDVPVVVNHRILGGWKYVTAETGRFFTDEDDVTDAVAACLAERFTPRAWFSANHGPERAASRLGVFLNSLADLTQPQWRAGGTRAAAAPG